MRARAALILNVCAMTAFVYAGYLLGHDSNRLGCVILIAMGVWFQICSEYVARRM